MTRKKSDSKCNTKFCRNSKAPGNHYCYKCIKRKWRKNNPEKATYMALKYNSRRRGKDFSLTFEEFVSFCKETNYIALKGKTSESASIDRINNSRGYELGNIRSISLSENSRNHKIPDDCPI